MNDLQGPIKNHWTAYPHWSWLFGFLSVLLAILSLLQGGALREIGVGKPQRALNVTVSNVQLIDVEERQFVPDLLLIYHGSSIAAVFNMNIEILNAGSTPFLPQDFQDPIKI